MTHDDSDPRGWINPETGEWELDKPSISATLPYAGSSGWSGSDASRERAERRDSSGKTGTLQAEIVECVRQQGQHGITIKTIREVFPEEHHGSLSGALTALHKAGRVLRLTEKRDRCSVYVAPQFLLGREAVPPKPATKSKPALPATRMDFGAENDYRTIRVYRDDELVFDGVGREALGQPRRSPDVDRAIVRVAGYLDGRANMSVLAGRDLIASSTSETGYAHLRVSDLETLLEALR